MKTAAATRTAGVLLTLFLLAACADNQPVPGSQSPDSSASTPSESAHSRRAVVTSADRPVRLHFERGGRLVARPATVSFGKHQEPFLRALELAAQAPSGSGLDAVVPANAFKDAGPDGADEASSIGVQLRRNWYAQPLARWDSDAARLALRATICTLQSVSGSRGVPVEFYPPSYGPKFTTLFGVPVPRAVGGRMDVACER